MWPSAFSVNVSVKVDIPKAIDRKFYPCAQGQVLPTCDAFPSRALEFSAQEERI